MDSASSVEKLHSVFNDLLNQRKTLGQYSLSRGMTLLQKGNYREAIQDFKRTLATNPDTVEAHKFMAMAYLKLDKKQEAIEAYKQVTKLVPNSAGAYVDLGNAYLEANRHGEAEKQYRRAMQLDPLNVVAPYTLGNLYLMQERLSEAEDIFSKVIKQAPQDGNARYALGRTYNKMERYDLAVKELEKALSLKRDFPAARFELGVAYAETGRKEEAQREANVLKDQDPKLYVDLKSKISKPQLGLHLDYLSSFNAYFGPKTPLWLLDESLAAPNASKEFTMVFQFAQRMDAASVMNPVNWSIGRGKGGAAGYYEHGMIPETDVAIPEIPKLISYDPTTLQARVTFTITQNAAGTGTIDPLHMVFKFSGKDIEGRAMDSTGDEFNAYANITF